VNLKPYWRQRRRGFSHACNVWIILTTSPFYDLLIIVSSTIARGNFRRLERSQTIHQGFVFSASGTMRPGPNCTNPFFHTRNVSERFPPVRNVSEIHLPFMRVTCQKWGSLRACSVSVIAPPSSLPAGTSGDRVGYSQKIYFRTHDFLETCRFLPLFCRYSCAYKVPKLK